MQGVDIFCTFLSLFSPNKFLPIYMCLIVTSLNGWRPSSCSNKRWNENTIPFGGICPTGSPIEPFWLVNGTAVGVTTAAWAPAALGIWCIVGKFVAGINGLFGSVDVTGLFCTIPTITPFVAFWKTKINFSRCIWI